MPVLRRNLNDWELKEMCRLLSSLDGKKSNPNVREGWLGLGNFY